MILFVALTLLLPQAPRGFEGVLDDDGGFTLAAPSPDARARYEAAAKYSKKHAGKSLLVIEGDHIVFEDNENGYDGKHGSALWSGTKSFACALALAAEADGTLSFDEKASATLPELAEHAIARDITVRQLLNFTSGLDDDGSVLTSDSVRSKPRVKDKYRWTLQNIGNLQLNKPGARFTYVSAHHAIFGALMTKKLGMDPIAYLHKKVLDPIGFKYTGWLRDPSGNALYPFGVYTTPRSWARFGVLVRDDGMFRGQRVLPAGAFAKCFQGSDAMPSYGMNWWLNVPIDKEKRKLLPFELYGLAQDGRAFLPDGPADLVTAVGYKGNRLYIVPSRGLVIVRFGDVSKTFTDPEQLRLLLGQ